MYVLKILTKIIIQEAIIIIYEKRERQLSNLMETSITVLLKNCLLPRDFYLALHDTTDHKLELTSEFLFYKQTSRCTKISDSDSSVRNL